MHSRPLLVCGVTEKSCEYSCYIGLNAIFSQKVFQFHEKGLTLQPSNYNEEMISSQNSQAIFAVQKEPSFAVLFNFFENSRW